MFGKNALIVDDSLTARSVLKHQLNQFDVVVESSPDGSHALKMLRSHTPDVIFLDHVMPGLDGFQVLERLKADNATRRIPVVMYTSQAAPKYIREAKILGAVAVIPKNVTDEELVDALNKAEVYQLGAANDDQHAAGSVRRVESAVDLSKPANSPSFEPELRSLSAGKGAASAEPLLDDEMPMARAESLDTFERRRRAGREQHAASGGWLLPLLLTALLCSQAYLLWRDGEQQATITELRELGAAERQRIAELNFRLDVHQAQLSATNSDMAELIMRLLMERVGDVGPEEKSEPAGDTALQEETQQ